MLLWLAYMKVMEKLWGFSFQRSQPTSLVGENEKNNGKLVEIIVSVFSWFVQKKCKKTTKKNYIKCVTAEL